MSFSILERAQILNEALPYIQKYAGKTIVVKYGGNAMISDELRQAVMSDIILLNLVGIRVVMVHGGGPEINEMLKKIGKESKFVGGLRYTDEETMDVVRMVLCGRVNKGLVNLISAAGGWPSACAVWTAACSAPSACGMTAWITAWWAKSLP